MMRAKAYNPGRVCDRCGSKMPPFFPRKRDGDELVCDNCLSKSAKQGGFNVSEETDEALGKESARKTASGKWSITIYRGDASKPITTTPASYSTPQEALEMARRLVKDSGWHESELNFAFYEEGGEYRWFKWDASDPNVFLGEMNARIPVKEARVRKTAKACEVCGRTATFWLPYDHAYCDEHMEFIRSLRERDPNEHDIGPGLDMYEEKPWLRPASRKVAHDSGDGETIYHCPFCGAGQVIGRSDGTAQCEFCDTAFTVQVQPSMSAVPQTIDGEPHIHDDMPGTVPGEFEDNEDQQPEDTEMDLEGDEVDDSIDSPKPNPFTKQESRYYRVDGDVVLPEDSYMRHLAIKYADDRDAVIEAVKSSRQRS